MQSTSCYSTKFSKIISEEHLIKSLRSLQGHWSKWFQTALHSFIPSEISTTCCVAGHLSVFDNCLEFLNSWRLPTLCFHCQVAAGSSGTVLLYFFELLCCMSKLTYKRNSSRNSRLNRRTKSSPWEPNNLWKQFLSILQQCSVTSISTPQDSVAWLIKCPMGCSSTFQDLLAKCFVELSYSCKWFSSTPPEYPTFSVSPLQRCPMISSSFLLFHNDIVLNWLSCLMFVKDSDQLEREQRGQMWEQQVRQQQNENNCNF